METSRHWKEMFNVLMVKEKINLSLMQTIIINLGLGSGSLEQVNKFSSVSGL